MRDKKRIKRIMEKMLSYWENNPDYRFNQIISNINYSIGESGVDIFYIEDDLFETGLDFIIQETAIGEME